MQECMQHALDSYKTSHQGRKDHYILTEFPEGNISTLQKELITVSW